MNKECKENCEDCRQPYDVCGCSCHLRPMTSKNNSKQFLAEKYTKKWLEDNKTLVEDYREICDLVMLFHANWGIEIGIVFKSLEDKIGRNSGIESVEKIFDAQAHIFKQKACSHAFKLTTGGMMCSKCSMYKS